MGTIRYTGQNLCSGKRMNIKAEKTEYKFNRLFILYTYVQSNINIGHKTTLISNQIPDIKAS